MWLGKAYQLISQYKFIAWLLVASYVWNEVNKNFACTLCFFHTFCDKAAGRRSTQTYGGRECKKKKEKKDPLTEGDNNYSVCINHLLDNKGCL